MLAKLLSTFIRLARCAEGFLLQKPFLNRLLSGSVLTAIAIVMETSGFAQERAIISGTVGGDSRQPLPGVTVGVLRAADSLLTAATFSNEQGYFEFTGVLPGRYLLSYTAVGYEATFSNAFTLAPAQRYDADPVWLIPVSAQLKLVSVTAARPVIQVAPDKTIFNIASSLSGTGSNAAALLQKMPGILVDDQGNISLKGKLGIRIYVDGRMLQLSGKDLTAYLRSINSNDIDAIELITAPGARYDASGNAGIINIRLRKKAASGANGNISLGYIQGLTPKGNGATGFNYRNEHLNLFATASANTGQYEMTIHSPRVLKGDTYDQRFQVINDMRNYNARIGIDWFVNTRQTIGLVATGNVSRDDWWSSSYTDIYLGSSNHYDRSLKALSNTPHRRSGINANLNYRYADSTGKELTADIDYGLFRGRAHAYQPNYYERYGRPISETITSNDMPTDIRMYTARIDASRPMAKGKLGMGLKVAYVATANQSGLFVLVNGIMAPAPDRSFSFDYTENVNAAYISYQRSPGRRWTLQLGLRAEQTNSRGILIRSDGVVQADKDTRRSYLDFFPNAMITYAAGDKHVLQLTYSRRIDRPVYQDLNPFELKVDDLTQQKGNSFLLPQYTHTVDLAHTWQQRFTTSAGYSRVSGFSAEIVDTLGNKTFNQQRNVATQHLLSLNFSADFRPASFWKMYGSAWGNYQHFEGSRETVGIAAQAYSFGITLQNNFEMGKGFTAELSGWYNGPGLYGPVFKTRAMGALDIGLQKALLEDKLSIRLGITDILHTGGVWRGSSALNGLQLYIRSVSETRTFRLSIQYHFGRPGLKGSRYRETGMTAEQKRIRGR